MASKQGGDAMPSFLRTVSVLSLAAILAACTSGGGSKVLQDFGIQDRPDDYVSGSDKVLARLPEVGKAELPRLNAAERAGEIKYEKMDSLRGAYYKRVKVYDDYRPVDANYTSRKSGRESVSYVGYVEYTYEFFESPRRESRIEAQAEIATIPTGKGGSELYRYHFGSGGTWDGGKGEPIKTR
jgi:hypothetical protein